MKTSKISKLIGFGLLLGATMVPALAVGTADASTAALLDDGTATVAIVKTFALALVAVVAALVFVGWGIKVFKSKGKL